MTKEKEVEIIGMPVTAPHVFQAISAITGELAKSGGISKTEKNSQQGYNFRGIDNVYNAVAPLLAKNGLCIIPRVLRREVVERTNKNGNALFYVTVEVEFDFVSAVDGSKHAGLAYGEAMDSGDKATNKAMSAAYKYICLQTFCIPTEGDNDADATTHEVKGLRDIKEDLEALSVAPEDKIRELFAALYKETNGFPQNADVKSVYEARKAELGIL